MFADDSGEMSAANFKIVRFFLSSKIFHVHTKTHAGNESASENMRISHQRRSHESAENGMSLISLFISSILSPLVYDNDDENENEKKNSTEDPEDE